MAIKFPFCPAIYLTAQKFSIPGTAVSHRTDHDLNNLDHLDRPDTLLQHRWCVFGVFYGPTALYPLGVHFALVTFVFTRVVSFN